MATVAIKGLNAVRSAVWLFNEHEWQPLHDSEIHTSSWAVNSALKVHYINYV